MTSELENKKNTLEYYKTVFSKRITDNITLEVDENGNFYPDYYWLINNMVLFHEICCRICEPQVNFKFNWYFKYYFDFLKEILERRNKFLIINIPPGHGKCHGKGTLIRMYDGTLKKVEDIVIGDKIMGDDSTPRNVISLGSNYSNMYKITMDDDTYFTCNEEHILYLYNINDKNFIKITVGNYLKQDEDFKKNHRMIKNKILYKYKKVDINPYFVGLYLSNKNKTLHTIELNKLNNKFFNNKKFKILDKIEKNKEFLNDYIFNNEDIRLKLLSGIIDGRGFIKSNNEIEILCNNLEKTNFIIDLSRSLGFYTKKYTKFIKNKEFYKIYIHGNIEKIPLKNKKNHFKDNPIYLSLQKFNIESIGYDKYYGFELDGNHLYLLDNYTVCHNTNSLISFVCLYIGFFPHTRFLIISGADTVRNKYVRHIKEILNSDYYQQLFPQVKIDKNQKNTEEVFFLEKFNYGEQIEGGGSITIKTMQGNITGTDSDFTIFDDPNDYTRFKTEKDTYLTKMNEIVSGCITRDRGIIGSEAPLIICMQRIAENDTTGYLLRLPNSSKWKHIEIPAKIENQTEEYYDAKNNKLLSGKYFISPYRKWFVKNGDFIFPDKFDDNRFELHRNLINNEIDFQWQMFQKCEEEDTKIFNINCINRYTLDNIKDINFEKRVISIDSSNGENDYQSMQLWGFNTYTNNITKRKELQSYLLEASLTQEKTPLFVRRVIDWYIEYQPDFIIVEEKSSGYEIINELEILIYGGLLDRKDPRKNKIVICFSPKLSKEDRAKSCSLEINNGRVFFPKEYNKITRLDKKQIYVIKEIERELNVFPSKNDSVHDDAVDSLSQVINWARNYFNKTKQRRINISYV